MDARSNRTVTRILSDGQDRMKALQGQIAARRNAPDVAGLTEALFEGWEIHAYAVERRVLPALAAAGLAPERIRALERALGTIRRLVSDFRLEQGAAAGLGLGNRSRLSRIFSAMDDYLEREREAFPLLEGEPGTDLAALRAHLERLPPVVRRVDVRAPLRASYEAWTAFGAYPRVQEELLEVARLEDRRLRWATGGAVAGIVLLGEETRDERLAWTSLEGPRHRGSVTFRSLDASATRILVELTCEPPGRPGEPGSVGARVQRALERFRKFVEQRPASPAE